MVAQGTPGFPKDPSRRSDSAPRCAGRGRRDSETELAGEHGLAQKQQGEGRRGCAGTPCSAGGGSTPACTRSPPAGSGRTSPRGSWARRSGGNRTGGRRHGGRAPHRRRRRACKPIRWPTVSDHRLGPLPGSGELSGRGPSRSGLLHPHRTKPRRAEAYFLVLKERCRTKPLRQQPGLPATHAPIIELSDAFSAPGRPDLNVHSGVRGGAGGNLKRDALAGKHGERQDLRGVSAGVGREGHQRPWVPLASTL